MISRAIEFDNQQQYTEAYKLYCEGLQFMVPLISAEPNATKKRKLRETADAYLQRAETIKNFNCGEQSTNSHHKCITQQTTSFSRLCELSFV